MTALGSKDAGRAAEEPRLRYLPALDGLRALAVSAVFLYHADIGWARGGFLGVDVFFVISGYLITALLLTDCRRTGHLRLVRFWTPAGPSAAAGGPAPAGRGLGGGTPAGADQGSGCGPTCWPPSAT